MFERFTKGARATVGGAVAHAERTGADTVSEECLLLALLDQEGGRAPFALAALGLTDRRESVEAALADARRRGGMTRADADALADIGIDLGAIVSRVEETHGEGALGRPRRPSSADGASPVHSGGQEDPGTVAPDRGRPR